MTTLYEITNEIAEFEMHVEAALREADGDMNDDNVQAVMSAFADSHLAEQLEDKADSYCQFIQELYARAEMRKKEGQRLLGRAKVDENLAKSLKERLIFVLNNRQIKKLDTKRFRVSVARAGKRPVVISGNVPDSFMKITAAPNKETIRAALEDGEALSFATLGESSQYLRIG